MSLRTSESLGNLGNLRNGSSPDRSLLDTPPTHDLWIRSIRPHLSHLSYSPRWLGNLRQVLFGACHPLSQNTEVDETNEVLKEFPGEERLYPSADSVKGVEEGEVHYPVQYLNFINSGGLPPSQLQVKLGVPLMLLRNLDVGHGLCNGTRPHSIRMTHSVTVLS